MNISPYHVGAEAGLMYTEQIGNRGTMIVTSDGSQLFFFLISTEESRKGQRPDDPIIAQILETFQFVSPIRPPIPTIGSKQTWKQYIDPNYHFEISYPDSFFFQIGPRTSIPTSDIYLSGLGNETGHFGLHISLHGLFGTQCTTLDDCFSQWQTNSFPNYGIPEKETIIVHRTILGKKTKGLQYTHSHNGKSIIRQFFPHKNGSYPFLFEIKATSYPLEDINPLIEEILSTYKITNL